MTKQHPHSSTLVIAACTLVLAGASCLWLFVGHGNRWLSPTIQLPAETEIETITARIQPAPPNETNFGPPFVIPPEYYPIILSTLTPTKESTDSAGRESMGELRITTKQQKTITITFFDGGKAHLKFSVNDVYCVRGGVQMPVLISGDYKGYADESMLLWKILQAIRARTLEGDKTDSLEYYIEQVKRVRGELPPK